MKTADTRVLVLDDDPFMCEALAIALGSEGYNVRTETDGTTINQSFSEFRPAVAVVDVNLGDGPDGFSVTRRLRAMSDLPVILVSASTSVEDRLSGFSVGGDDFMVKPFSMAEMLMRVEALLRRANHGTSSVIEVGDIRIDDRAHVATRAGKVLPLRNLEYKLLAHLLPSQRTGAVEGPAARRGVGLRPLRRQPGRGPRQPPPGQARGVRSPGHPDRPQRRLRARPQLRHRLTHQLLIR